LFAQDVDLFGDNLQQNLLKNYIIFFSVKVFILEVPIWEVDVPPELRNLDLLLLTALPLDRLILLTLTVKIILKNTN
jgi:hypothetical protein